MNRLNLANPPFRRTSGFTQIEWMVASSLFAVLFAMTAPLFESVRENARAAQCRNNMRSIAFAVLDYENEHGILPGPVFRRVRTPVGEPHPSELNWNMDEYFGPNAPVWNCPTNARTLDAKVNPGRVMFLLLNLRETSPSNWFGYVRTQPRAPVAISDIIRHSPLPPGNMIRDLRNIWMIADADGWNYDALSISGGGSLGPDTFPIDSNAGPVHRGGRNYVFFDGHAELLMPVDFPPFSGVIRD